MSLAERIQTQGIIISASVYRDYDCIVSLFTEEHGLIKLFIKAAFSSKKNKGAGITTPLTLVDVVFSKKQSELYTCHEISVLNHNLSLRNNLSILNAACEMIKMIETTQHPERQAKELYHLLEAYLKRLPLAPHPPTITESFRLKLCRFEGSFGFISHCNCCALPLADAWLYEGLAFCHYHKEPGSLCFSSHEKEIVEQLAFSQDFTQIASLTIPQSLREKIIKITSL